MTTFKNKFLKYILVIPLVLSICYWVDAEDLTKKEALILFRSKLNKIRENDAEGYLELAKFCLKYGLMGHAEIMLNKALNINPNLKKSARSVIEQIDNSKAESLLRQATEDYKLGFYAEAKQKIDRIISLYPKSGFAVEANRLLEYVYMDTRNKSYLLTPVATNMSEYQVILKRLEDRAKKEEKDVAELRVEYFSNLLKKAEYYANVMTAEEKSYQLNQNYLFYSIRCLRWILESKQGQLKIKADNIEKEVIRELFKNYSEFSKGQRDQYYHLLYHVDDKKFKAKICKEYFNKGKQYLESADKVKGEEKAERLERALDYFYIVHDYSASGELKNEAFSNLKTIKYKLRSLR